MKRESWCHLQRPFATSRALTSVWNIWTSNSVSHARLDITSTKTELARSTLTTESQIVSDTQIKSLVPNVRSLISSLQMNVKREPWWTIAPSTIDSLRLVSSVMLPTFYLEITVSHDPFQDESSNVLRTISKLMSVLAVRKGLNWQMISRAVC